VKGITQVQTPPLQMKPTQNEAPEIYAKNNFLGSSITTPNLAGLVGGADASGVLNLTPLIPAQQTALFQALDLTKTAPTGAALAVVDIAAGTDLKWPGRPWRT